MDEMISTAEALKISVLISTLKIGHLGARGTVGLKHSDNNRLWLTVYTRSFVAAQYSVPSRASALALWTTVLKITITYTYHNLVKNHNYS